MHDRFALVLRLLTPGVLLLTTLAYAGDPLRIGQSIITKFPSPMEICLPQVVVRGHTFNSVQLNHYLVISPEDRSKAGDIFVGFRLKSQPDAIWLTNGSSWWTATDEEDSHIPKVYGHFNELPPFAYLEIFNNLENVSAYIGDGEIWAGYGLRKDGATWQDAYEDMIQNQRFKILWEIGLDSGQSLRPQHGLYEAQSIICLTATGMREEANFPCCTTHEDDSGQE